MNEKIAYFDNAATTFPKPECVYEFMNDFYRNSCGNAAYRRIETDRSNSTWKIWIEWNFQSDGKA
jgi:selenocysteine lyase/cysteine desulfurase